MKGIDLKRKIKVSKIMCTNIKIAVIVCAVLTALCLSTTIAFSQRLSKKENTNKDSFMKWPEPSEFQNPAYPAPDWLRDAVILEVPIRAFNHPDYKNNKLWKNQFGDASYLSIIDKLGFINELGVNVICLYTVYHHTPGTNLYAIRHHEANPELGTLEDIKMLIDKAHQMGIRVISNTNHYGVDQTSPMIDENPDWFLPKEEHLYGQRVFDINHPEVIKYIIDTHVWWCTEIGLDGWRIDIAHETYRKYIWDPVLKGCFSKNKQILLATEGAHLDAHIRGAGWSYFPPSRDMEDPRFTWDSPHAEYGSLYGFNNTTADNPYRVKDISSHNSKTPCAHNYDPEKCPREGAYNIKGSRYLFGHNLLFASFVPWMMAGELFNATHLVVPGLLNHGINGKLLHSYLDWDDADKQQDVINDFTRIVNIRRKHKDIFHNNWYETNLINVPNSSVPYSNVRPYVRFIPGEKAIIVIGNNNTEHDVAFNLQIPLEKLGFGKENEFAVTDLWTENKRTMNAEELNNYSVVVPKDKSPGGGVRAILVSKK